MKSWEEIHEDVFGCQPDYLSDLYDSMAVCLGNIIYGI
jgi:hypothetical protein